MASGSKFSIFDETAIPTLTEDKILWSSIRKGNQLAFSSFFKKYVNQLYNYGMHLHAEKALVMDCIQEVFIGFWHKKDTLSEVDMVRVYLFKSFRNLLFSKLAQSKKMISLDFWEDAYPVQEESFEASVIAEETRNQRLVNLQLAIAHLTKRQRESILLKYYNGLEAKQVAEIMGISVAAVHNLISKSLEALRIHFKK